MSTITYTKYGNEIKIHTEDIIVKPYFDIIINNNYELSKTLNNITYNVNEISSNNISDLAEENLNRRYSGHLLKIYTDECDTDLLDIDIFNNSEKKVNSSYSNINNLSNADFKYPYWNKGSWNLNYFRNTLNSLGNDKKEDGSHPLTQLESSIQDNRLFGLSDQHSLVYGKYFIFRFIFDKHFKFENISINYN